MPTGRDRSRPHHRAAIGGVVALALALAGCGSLPDSLPGLGSDDAATTAASAKSGPAVGTTVPGPEFADRVIAGVRKGRNATITAEQREAGADPETLKGLLDATSDPAGISIDVGTGDEGISAISSGGDLFVNPATPDDPPWLKLTSDADDMASAMIRGLAEVLVYAVNPFALKDQWAAVDTWTVAGRSVIDGDQVIRYTARLDTEQALLGLPKQLRESADYRSAAVTGSVTVFLDEDDLPRRVGSRIVGKQGGEKIDTAISITFGDWGSAPAVSPPPADQVTDLSKELDGTAEELGGGA